MGDQKRGQFHVPTRIGKSFMETMLFKLTSTIVSKPGTGSGRKKQQVQNQNRFRVNVFFLDNGKSCHNGIEPWFGCMCVYSKNDVHTKFLMVYKKILLVVTYKEQGSYPSELLNVIKFFFYYKLALLLIKYFLKSSMVTVSTKMMLFSP